MILLASRIWIRRRTLFLILWLWFFIEVWIHLCQLSFCFKSHKITKSSALYVCILGLLFPPSANDAFLCMVLYVFTWIRSLILVSGSDYNLLHGAALVLKPRIIDVSDFFLKKILQRIIWESLILQTFSSLGWIHLVFKMIRKISKIYS